MIKTRSDSTQVWVTNASAIGGGPGSTSIVNSAGWVVNVGNSAGWVVSIANTVAGGDIVQISNSAGWVVSIANTVAGGDIVQISNSAGWIVNVANTSNVVAVSNTSPLVQVQNSSGWIFAQSNTSPLVSVQNSAGWIVNVANTGGSVVVSNTQTAINITNSAGWIVAVSNTNGNTNITNSAGWIVSVANTGGAVTVANSSRIVSSYDVSYSMDGQSQVVMQYGTINITNSTNTVVIRAQSDKRIKVMSLFLISQGTGLVVWQSGSSSGIGLTGPTYLASNVGYVLPFHINGWFQTQTSTLLNLNLTSATSIGGCITYLVTS